MLDFLRATDKPKVNDILLTKPVQQIAESESINDRVEQSSDVTSVPETAPAVFNVNQQTSGKPGIEDTPQWKAAHRQYDSPEQKSAESENVVTETSQIKAVSSILDEIRAVEIFANTGSQTEHIQLQSGNDIEKSQVLLGDTGNIEEQKQEAYLPKCL